MLMMATKIGRNDPCHCGSGKKYKRCRLEDDPQNDREARTAFTAALAAEHAEEEEFYEWSDRLDE
jgi:hypothetical protein